MVNMQISEVSRFWMKEHITLTKELKKENFSFNKFQHISTLQPNYPIIAPSNLDTTTSHDFHQAATRPGAFGAARAHQTRRVRGWHTDGTAGAIIAIAFSEGCAWDGWRTGIHPFGHYQRPKTHLRSSDVTLKPSNTFSFL